MRESILRGAAAVLAPLLGRITGFLDLSDPWSSSEVRIKPSHFGTGNRHRFGWYLDGTSIVTVRSVEEVCSWLLECEYRSDQDLFGEADFWQHPRTFERLRAGDCEDFALWGWRKLLELGFSDARFYVGRIRGVEGAHAWAMFTDDRDHWLLEGTARDHPVLRGFASVRDRYEPWFSVGGELSSSVHDGYFQWLGERWGHRRPSPPPGDLHNTRLLLAVGVPASS